MNDPETLGEALPHEIARVRDRVLPLYLHLRSHPNVIVVPQIAFIRSTLNEASKAMIEGDVVEMLRVYQVLKDITE